MIGAMRVTVAPGRLTGLSPMIVASRAKYLGWRQSGPGSSFYEREGSDTIEIPERTDPDYVEKVEKVIQQFADDEHTDGLEQLMVLRGWGA